jgi:cathepsin E
MGFWGEHGFLCFGIASNTLFCSIGPRDLTYNTLIPDSTSEIPTVTDNLFEQGLIKQNFIAVSFEPTYSTSVVANGELMFGSIDPTKFIGNLIFL